MDIEVASVTGGAPSAGRDGHDCASARGRGLWTSSWMGGGAVPTPGLNHFKRLYTLLRSVLGRTTLTTLGAFLPTGAGTVHPGRREGTNSSQNLPGLRARTYACHYHHPLQLPPLYYSVRCTQYQPKYTPLPPPLHRRPSPSSHPDRKAKPSTTTMTRGRIWNTYGERGGGTEGKVYSTYYNLQHTHTRGSLYLSLPYPRTPTGTTGYWRRQKDQTRRPFPYGGRSPPRPRAKPCHLRFSIMCVCVCACAYRNEWREYFVGQRENVDGAFAPTTTASIQMGPR